MTPRKPLTEWQQTTTPPRLPWHIRRNIGLGPGGCWLWLRALSRDGYGWASLDNKTHQAHRLIYSLIKGNPQDLQLDHLCRVRHCVNPDHLEPVTAAENGLRSPITTAGRPRCLRCGGEFVVIGHNHPQRRCAPCAREWRRNYARIQRAKKRAAQ